MKKFFIILLCVTLLLPAGCGKTQTDPDNTTTETTAEDGTSSTTTAATTAAATSEPKVFTPMSDAELEAYYAAKWRAIIKTIKDGDFLYILTQDAEPRVYIDRYSLTDGSFLGTSIGSEKQKIKYISILPQTP